MYDINVGEQSIYARIFYKSYSGCYDTSEIKLRGIEAPVLQVVEDWKLCDPGGSFFFDLSEKTAEVLGDQDSNLFLVSYFESAQEEQENKNPLSSMQVNANLVQSVYFRIQNRQRASCFQTGNFELQLGSGFISLTPENLATCDEGDGYGRFDTSLWLPNVLGDQTGFKVSFFTENGSILPTPLPDYYRNSNANTERIFARVENQLEPLCFSETSFELMINKKQELLLQDNYNLCVLEPFLILSPAGVFDTWEWQDSSGKVISNTAEVSLTAAGNYSVRVSTSENGVSCENSYAFTLIRSQIPAITEVKNQEWSSSNYLEIMEGGDPDLEYSIDGVNFQDSNYFGNLPGGIYSVFARDKMGCGMAIYEVTLIDYPKYFTPNNDGYHDHWQIKGVATQTQSRVLIFDRYGKLLKDMSSLGQGWDGTFNGKTMPADDYWFSITLEDGKILKEHFSLIR